MKRAVTLACAVAISLGLGFWGSTGAQAGMMGGSMGYHSGGFSGASRSSFSGGYFGGYRGGYPHYGFGFGRNSLALSFSFGGYGGPAYYNYGGYYPYAYYPAPVYYSPPVYYSSSPVVYTAPQSSAAAYDNNTPSAPTVIQNAPPAPPGPAVQTMRPADVVALVKSGLSDDVVTSQIRSSRMVFHLSTAEIIDLKNNGVSDKLIDFMINTATP